MTCSLAFCILERYSKALLGGVRVVTFVKGCVLYHLVEHVRMMIDDMTNLRGGYYSTVRRPSINCL